MANKTLSQPNLKSKECKVCGAIHLAGIEPKAKFNYGLTDSQVNILGNIGDALEGLDKALASKDDDGVRDNDELQAFSGMARGIACAVAGLFNDVVDQKIGGAQ